MRNMMVVLAAVVAAVTSAPAVNVGEPAPGFSLSTYGGGTFNLADQKGKVTVIFFLGCT
jgi:cytochrome oxidase Cu insertion factor (SCO1/SenC/PrrC family)